MMSLMRYVVRGLVVVGLTGLVVGAIAVFVGSVGSVDCKDCLAEEFDSVFWAWVFVVGVSSTLAALALVGISFTWYVIGLIFDEF